MFSNDELPELFQGDLDAEQLDALFADLERGAQVQLVQVRTSSGPSPHDRQVTLAEARVLLRQTDTKAVQIRYEFEQQSWCDTLMVLPTGVRLVRTKVSG
ncbi:MAG: hypothetical protein ACR2NU_01165 [Aeoliella sp.]